MFKAANKAIERRMMAAELNKANLPVDKHPHTSREISIFFVDGKIISEYELHDRLVLQRELGRFAGVTQNTIQKRDW
jgi:hypothetical protein